VSNILTRLRLRRTKSADDTPAADQSREPRTRFGAWLGRPMTSFHLIIAVTALLVTLGLTMVLSASGVHSYDEDGSPWAIFARQVLWTIVGLIAFYIALRMPVQLMRRLAFSGFALSIIMLVLVLVPGIGKEANGSRGWFVIAGLSMQPSELAKIAFAIWGAHLLAARRLERASLREMLIPLVPAAVIALALIVAQPDLGQTVSLGIILLGLLWYAGRPAGVRELAVRRHGLGSVLAVSEGYRSDRVQSGSTPVPTSRALATRPARRGSRWPTAACSVTGWGRAPPSGTICPTPTTTSSSRSSARSSASSAPSGCCACSGFSPTPGCGSRVAPPTRSCGCSPPPRRCG
jgi:cell division protein FtsW